MREKVYNDIENLVDEVLEGVVCASKGRLRKLKQTTVIHRTELPVGRVGIVVGGGSGHEPMFTHYVGQGMASACAAGHLFAAPSPDIVLAATEKADTGKGVLHLRINYAGDIMNFDVASELATDLGISVESVNITDDIASAPADCAADRRGIAGAVLVVKAVGAAAETGASLSILAEIARKANEAVRSIGVAFGPGSLPGETRPFFDIKHGEMEIGVGIHGEMGVRREKKTSADAIACLLVKHIVDELHLSRGDEVVTLVNDLGSMTMQELAIINRKVFTCLNDLGIIVHRPFMGNFCSAQDMAGLSLSIMKLDAELKRYIDAPATAIGWPGGI